MIQQYYVAYLELVDCNLCPLGLRLLGHKRIYYEKTNASAVR